MVHCIWWEHRDIVFECFKQISVSPIKLFLSLTVSKNQFYLDFSDLLGLCLSRMNICWKTLYKTCTCLKLHNRYLFYKTDPLFYETRHLSLRSYQTELNGATNGASLYVCLSLYAVSSQPCSLGLTVCEWRFVKDIFPKDQWVS